MQYSRVWFGIIRLQRPMTERCTHGVWQWIASYGTGWEEPQESTVWLKGDTDKNINGNQKINSSPENCGKQTPRGHYIFTCVFCDPFIWGESEGLLCRSGSLLSLSASRRYCCIIRALWSCCHGDMGQSHRSERWCASAAWIWSRQEALDECRSARTSRAPVTAGGLGGGGRGGEGVLRGAKC